MIVLRRVVDLKNNRNLRIEKLDVESREIGLGVEHQPVGTAREWFFNQKEGFNPPVFVSPRMTKFGPGFVRVLYVQVDGDTARRRAARYVEYVR